MNKEETLKMLENGMTVGRLINELSQYDSNMLVINERDRDYSPVSCVSETNVDYCFDEIISKKVVSIW